MNAGVFLVPAVYEVAAAAELAVATGAAEKPDTHALSDRPALDTRTKRIDSADNLVTRDARPLDREQSIYGRCVGVAYTACLNADANVSQRRTDHRL
jgi:hypothetical protein